MDGDREGGSTKCRSRVERISKLKGAIAPHFRRRVAHRIASECELCGPRRSRLEKLLRQDHLKAIARAAVPMGTRHAAVDVETLAANAQRLAIDHILAHVHAFHEADDESILADLQGAPFCALQTGRHLRDSLWLDDGGRSSR